MPRVGLAYLPPRAGRRGKLYFRLGAASGRGRHQSLPRLGRAGPLEPAERPGRGASATTGITSPATICSTSPQDWADAHASGRSLATGRYRDGGQGAQGPSLFAIAPWDAGQSAAAGRDPAGDAPAALRQRLRAEPAQHGRLPPLRRVDGRGVAHRRRPKPPCSSSAPRAPATAGTAAPTAPTSRPGRPTASGAGGRAGFVGQFLFYDPADLAAVASGQMETWAAAALRHAGGRRGPVPRRLDAAKASPGGGGL